MYAPERFSLSDARIFARYFTVSFTVLDLTFPALLLTRQ